mgnify:CR=1 FL=1
MKTIQEHMDSFQKQMWGHSKPLEFCVEVVQELLSEIQRQRTVMRAGLEELDKHWTDVSKDAAGSKYDELITLMDNLGSKRQGFYPQYLSIEEHEEFVNSLRTQVDFANMVKGAASKANATEEQE